MIFTADREEFAASASEVQLKDETYLIGSVRTGLRKIGKDDDWYEPLLNRVEQVMRTAYRRESGHVSSDALRAAVARMRREVTESLRKTKAPTKEQLEARAKSIAASLASFAIASGVELAANDDPEEIGLEWVTMHDDRVRTPHRQADGQVRLPGQKYDVGGVEMSRPGDVTAPIELWINCRCALRPTAKGAAMVAAATNRAERLAVWSKQTTDPTGGDMSDTEVVDAPAEVADDDISDITEPVEADEPVPFYGVLAPEGVVSGDSRRFNVGGLEWRDLPLPFSWQKVNMEGHDGSVVVGRLDDIWRDENNLIQYNGTFLLTPEADEFIGLVAERAVRGVSVDVDKAEMSFVDADDNPITMDSAIDMDTVVISNVSGRISGATGCAIPAFMEANINLGLRPEVVDEEAVTDQSQEVDLEDVDASISDEVLAAAGTFREFPADERKKEADKGNAMPDGSFPIANEDDLKNAIQSIGRAKDPAAAKAHIKKRARELGAENLIPDDWSGSSETFARGVKTEDGPGWITHPVDTDRLRDYWVRGKGAAKIAWGTPGDFNRCRAQVAKYVKPQHLAGYCANRHYDALGFWPGRPVSGETVTLGGQSLHLVASAGTKVKAPPREWFENPNLLEPTRLSITEDGHIFGHLAQWGVCHIGLSGACTTPPESPSDYLYFATGVLDTDGGPVPVGQITMGCGHAGEGKARIAAAHYDDLGFAVADIAIGQDDIGIWFSGAMRETATEQQIRDLRAAGSVSGDWREYPYGSENLELFAALAVNVPGFPIEPTRIAASGGHQTMLVAAGVVLTPEKSQATLKEIVAAAVDQRLADIEAARLMADLAQRTKRDPKSVLASIASRRGKV